MGMRKISCNPDLLLENIEELYKEDTHPDLDIFCQDGIFKSYKLLFGACSGLLKECLCYNLENSCLILPNISTWELKAFHSTLLKFKCSPENEVLDAVLKVLTTIGVDIGQYLAVNLGSTNSNLDIQSLELLTVDTKIEPSQGCEKHEIVLPESLEVIPLQARLNPKPSSQIQDKLKPQQISRQNQTNEDNSAVKDKSSKLTEYSCPLCSHIFKSLSSYEKHLSNHQNNQIQQELAIISMTSIQEEEEELELDPNAEELIHVYECDKCHQTFSTTKKLTDHYKTHELREYSCELCSKTFKLKSTLTNHMKFHDARERARKFTCDICNSDFSHPSNLKRHIKTVHGDESEKRTYACDICNKLFKDRGTLKSHIENHNSTRRFQCEFCNKSYTRKSMLEAHYRVHTGEKPFECNICGKRFRLNGHLKSHKLSRHVGMKLEKSNLCAECGQGFIKEYDLRIHLRRHRGEKPFSCNICNKDFLGERNFRDHKRIHTGEMPYECETCEKAFRTSSGIRQHFKTSQNCRINASEGAYSKFKQKRTEWQRLEGLSLSELITTEGTLNLNEYTVEQSQDIRDELREEIHQETIVLKEGGNSQQAIILKEGTHQETIVYLTEPELAGLVSGQVVPIQIDTQGNEVVLTEFLQ